MRWRRAAEVKFHKLWRHHTSHDDAVATAIAQVPLAREDGDTRAVVQLDADQLKQLSAVFSAPRWLRDLGIASWLLVGVAALLVGLTWVLGMTSTIVVPVLVGLVVATVGSPAVSWMHRHRIPRALGALVVLLFVIAIAVVIVILVVGGLRAQSDTIAAEANAAADKFQQWLKDLGVDQSGASAASNNLKSSVPDIISVFTKGLAAGISGLASVGFFIAFTAFSTFMLLKDGPLLRRWLNSHMSVPVVVGNTITGRVVHSVRQYFLGTTIVAAFNAVVVGVGSVLLGVPLAGTIAVVTFVTAYIPFVGAFVSGAFAVVLALGAKGTTTAAIMLVIVLLANGLLQNIVSPIAMGATLRMNPLLILVVTISAGAFFGTAGLILAAPLTAAAIHISGDLAKVRRAQAAPVTRPAPPPT
jgi:predicted PurR-regulated permease PerM